MKGIALITGATAGIGEASAFKLASLGYDLIITGRRASNMEHIEQRLIKEFPNQKVLPLCFDIQDRNACLNTLQSMPAHWKNISILINNAGLAVGLEPVFEGEIDDWERMIDTNVKGLLYVSRIVTPWMIKNQNGTIINIGSIAGKQVYPSGGVYCATKHAVQAITQSMRIDMVKYNIKVCSICPGNAETEFSDVRFKGNVERAKQVYSGYTPLYANDIADTVEFVVTRPAHVNINDILITCTAQADVYNFNKTS